MDRRKFLPFIVLGAIGLFVVLATIFYAANLNLIKFKLAEVSARAIFKEGNRFYRSMWGQYRQLTKRVRTF